MKQTMTRKEVFEEIETERGFQATLGHDHDHTVAEFLLIIERELQEAKDGWMKNKPQRHSAMSEIMQIAAVCVAAMEQHGVDGN